MNRSAPYPQPDLDTSHASQGLIVQLQRYFAAKNSHDVDAFMGEFSKELLTYTDAILGWQFNDYESLRGVLANYMPSWGVGRSYPLRLIGDHNSAVVVLSDTPELFGSEIQAIAAVDFANGKVTRWVDYWDSADFDPVLRDQMQCPEDHYPGTFAGERPDGRLDLAISDVVNQLHHAVSSGDSEKVATLFSFDARYEDMASRTLITGRRAIGAYISRIWEIAPFGKDACVRHVLGGALGGGYEWRASHASNVRSGISVIELDANGHIDRLTTTYDSKRLPASTRRLLIDAAHR
ncbi:hypothetical protein [Caballeronia sp. J97]|uniref:hypothetical protein n=1 Tax=Caballeronia sp. J97 TaxID=2805429 RepID=UPI002AAF85CA|nr:hypothetical protein [Caballeronia sp. J97]